LAELIHATQAFLNNNLLDFQAANPQVKIVNESMTSVGDEFRTAVKTDFSTGNEADVTFFYTGADVKGIIEAEKPLYPMKKSGKAIRNVGKDYI
jgi:raffinose/stachyose/melibiose transport system substrate-binding protein